jgi:hypothetical protein
MESDKRMPVTTISLDNEEYVFSIPDHSDKPYDTDVHLFVYQIYTFATVSYTSGTVCKSMCGNTYKVLKVSIPRKEFTKETKTECNPEHINAVSNVVRVFANTAIHNLINELLDKIQKEPDRRSISISPSNSIVLLYSSP